MISNNPFLPCLFKIYGLMASFLIGETTYFLIGKSFSGLKLFFWIKKLVWTIMPRRNAPLMS